MKTKIGLALALCAIAATPLARAQSDAAAALADCRAHQERLQELEDNYVTPDPPSYGSSQAQQFGTGERERERMLTEETCAYAQGLMQSSGPPRSAPKAPPPAPRAPQFRSDEPATAMPFRSDEVPGAPQSAAPPPETAPPPPPPPPRRVMRRPPPPPAPPSVGGTRARHPESEEPAPPPPP
jgi:hypothetical protein